MEQIVSLLLQLQPAREIVALDFRNVSVPLGVDVGVRGDPAREGRLLAVGDVGVILAHHRGGIRIQHAANDVHFLRNGLADELFVELNRANTAVGELVVVPVGIEFVRENARELIPHAADGLLSSVYMVLI